MMSSSSNFWHSLLRLIHVYAGILIAPFIFIAAFTGFLYASSPQIEQYLYRQQLYIQAENQQPQQLSQQIRAALAVMPDSAKITEVRPAPASDRTTQVIYSDPESGVSNQAVFVNPYTLNITGQLPVYGTSGVLPLRTRLDQLHSNLLLGDYGRLYSELAASWLAILSLSGLYHWYKRRKNRSPYKSAALKWHSSTGLILLPLLLGVAITGLTWSKWTGENIRILRTMLNWQTPSLTTALVQSSTIEPVTHHHTAAAMHSVHLALPPAAQFDQALLLARQHGITSKQLQIKPPVEANTAWTVSEIRRRWPTQADSIALDLQNNRVIDHLYFKDFPLAAKLTRWGVDAHIGVLFGWLNQLILMLYALALCILILCAYWLWLVKSRMKQRTFNFVDQCLKLWKTGTYPQKLGLILGQIVLLICLPTLAISIGLAIVFILLNQHKPTYR